MHAKTFLLVVIVLGLFATPFGGIAPATAHASVSTTLPSGPATPVAAAGPTPAAIPPTWTLLGNNPPPRHSHGFVYDSVADRFVLFGGATGLQSSGLTNSTWKYDLSSNTWTNVTPFVSPSPRAGFGMVYDSRADRVVLFGGETISGMVNSETWVFNPAGAVWTHRIPANSPPARRVFSAVYDAAADRTIIFGGIGSSLSVLTDTWAYDYTTNTWTPLNVTSPGGLFGASMTYDPVVHQDILFGGVSYVGFTPTYHDSTWSLDYGNLTWTNRSPVTHPSLRGLSAMDFHATRGHALLFGGEGVSGLVTTVHNDSWEYDAVGNNWTNVTPVLNPSVRLLSAMDFDPAANSTVLFGGMNSTGYPSDDAWAFGYGGAVPAQPRNLVAVPGHSNVTLTWQWPINNGTLPVRNYKIYRSNVPGGEGFLATVGAVLTYVDVAVVPGTTYYYEVSAVNGIGEGQRSNEAFATPLPPATVPTAPRNPMATGGNAQIVLTWQAPASDGGSPITNYSIYRGATSGSETLLTTVGDVLTYTNTGLTNGQTYYYEIAAINAVGEGPKSTEVSATPTGAPSAPRSLVATAGNAQVVLTWQAPISIGGASVTNYKVYRGTGSGSETLLTTLGNVLTYTDSAVTNGVTYYYQVSAVNSAGEGPMSNEAHATPVAPTDTTPPSITISSPSNGAAFTQATVTVSGVASDNVAVQKVELSTDGSTWTLASGTTQWSGSVTLVAGSNTIYARATDTSGNAATVHITLTLTTTAPPPQGLDPLVLVGIGIVVVVAVAAVLFLLWRRRKKAAPSPPPPPPPPGT